MLCIFNYYLINEVGFEFLSNFKHHLITNNALYHNEHVLNCDKISCRKTPLNIGSLFQNLICTGNLSTLLQLLILNKAYYLEIKIGLINESHQISRHAAILELFLNRKRGNAGSLCIKHGTLSIVSHYIHIVSVNSIYLYLLFFENNSKVLIG